MASLRNGSWYRCADGTIFEPLDLLHSMFFPNHGRDARGENVCFLPRHMKIPYLEKILPVQTEMFLPEDLVDCTIGLVMVSFFATLAFIAVKYIWETADQRFNSVNPSHKKWYVVANLSKSLILGCMALSPKYWISFYKLLFGNFQLLELKRTMVLYIVSDLVALYMVPKLPTSTILHHVTTIITGFVVYGLNLQVKGGAGIVGFAKISICYGYFSTIPFLVNAYLGLRVVYPKSAVVKNLCRLSLVTYLICCGLNWSLHFLWLFGYWGDLEFGIFTLLYCVVLYFVVHDDIVLIKWLWKQNSPVNAAPVKKMS